MIEVVDVQGGELVTASITIAADTLREVGLVYKDIYRDRYGVFARIDWWLTAFTLYFSKYGTSDHNSPFHGDTLDPWSVTIKKVREYPMSAASGPGSVGPGWWSIYMWTGEVDGPAYVNMLKVKKKYESQYGQWLRREG